MQSCMKSDMPHWLLKKPYCGSEVRQVQIKQSKMLCSSCWWPQKHGAALRFGILFAQRFCRWELGPFFYTSLARIIGRQVADCVSLVFLSRFDRLNRPPIKQNGDGDTQKKTEAGSWLTNASPFTFRSPVTTLNSTGLRALYIRPTIHPPSLLASSHLPWACRRGCSYLLHYPWQADGSKEEQWWHPRLWVECVFVCVHRSISLLCLHYSIYKWFFVMNTRSLNLSSMLKIKYPFFLYLHLSAYWLPSPIRFNLSLKKQ